MSHEIEADFKEDWDNEETQCQRCTSFRDEDCFCNEAQAQVPPTAHCDFFQSKD
jgi:hypothetical protein